MRALLSLLVVTAAALPAIAEAQPALRVRMLIAEDQRAATDAELEPLRQGLRSGDADTRRQAVRAIGRLERPELMRLISPFLTDRNNDVRVETANAIAQLALGPDGISAAKSRLLVRARGETTPRVRGAIAAALGRIPYTSATDVQQVERAIAALLPAASEAQRSAVVNLDEIAGAVEGLEALIRQTAKIGRPAADTLARLRGVAAIEGRAQDAEVLARIRRLSRAALTAAGGVTRDLLDVSMNAADDEVRRLAMVAARAEIDGREASIRRGLADRAPRVRYEALQTWGRAFQKQSCEPVVAAIRDPDPHVTLLAIDLLGNGCPDGEAGSYDVLNRLAQSSIPAAWHAPAHAIVSLAKVRPESARAQLAKFVASPTWQVRMYAARAAAALRATEVLEQLGRDAHDNVREAALAELTQLKSPAAATLALEALSRHDYQLMMTAAKALAVAGAGDRTVTALRSTLVQLIGEHRDNSMDARRAIVEALDRLGVPLTAAEKANALQRVPIETSAISAAALDDLAKTTLRFHIAGKGAFDLRLFADQAPLSALRVATLARDGYYNGLTFHRVVPNFVIQGGSPAANEYVGDALYMRDEVGILPHRRGTVGISTRGRDTGDAQIFVNLVDLPRLNHIYTVFAEVIAGMDVVDAVLEGDVIERVEVSGRRRPSH